MKKKKTDEELLAAEGFEIVCESPFEIQSKDGCFANYFVARTYINALRYGIRFGKSKDEKLAKKARKITLDYVRLSNMSDADYIRKMTGLFIKK